MEVLNITMNRIGSEGGKGREGVQYREYREGRGIYR
jgi:hypothetical protein